MDYEEGKHRMNHKICFVTTVCFVPTGVSLLAGRVFTHFLKTDRVSITEVTDKEREDESKRVRKQTNKQTFCL